MFSGFSIAAYRFVRRSSAPAAASRINRLLEQQLVLCLVRRWSGWPAGPVPRFRRSDTCCWAQRTRRRRASACRAFATGFGRVDSLEWVTRLFYCYKRRAAENCFEDKRVFQLSFRDFASRRTDNPRAQHSGHIAWHSAVTIFSQLMTFVFIFTIHVTDSLMSCSLYYCSICKLRVFWFSLAFSIYYTLYWIALSLYLSFLSYSTYMATACCSLATSHCLLCIQR